MADQREDDMASQIVLASASPRRSSLLDAAGISFETAEAHISEYIPDGTEPRIASMYNALKKAQYVSREYPEAFVIGADTIVYDGRILGKPSDEEDAFNVLGELRDSTHAVYTGVCIVRADEGMWLPMFVERLNYVDMQKMGLQLTPEELYSINNSSLIQFKKLLTVKIV